MIKDILTAAGVLHKKARFPKPPAQTYAVYFDDVVGEGADPVGGKAVGLARLYHHDCTVEVYEPDQDDATEEAIEAELEAKGLDWEKDDRFWLQDVQRYQTIYTFSYTSKTK